MGYIKTSGVVIKGVNTGEADKVITILTKSHGKVTAFAKSARRPKSKFVAGTQLLCYSDFILYTGKDMHTVNSSDVIEPFYEVRNDVIKLTYAAYICDLINDAVQYEQPSTRLLQLFLNTLHMLSRTEKSPELIARIFELRFLTILGYAPQVKACICCGDDQSDDVYFSFADCGLICGSCAGAAGKGMHLLPGTARALRHIVHSRMDNLFSFNVSGDVLDELGRVMRVYMRDRLEREYTKLDFLKTLKIDN